MSLYLKQYWKVGGRMQHYSEVRVGARGRPVTMNNKRTWQFSVPWGIMGNSNWASISLAYVLIEPGTTH